MPLIKKLYSKIAQSFRRAGRAVKSRLALYNGFYAKASGARILAYHGVCLEEHTKFNTLFVTQTTFEKHLQFYKKHFHVITLTEFYNGDFLPGRFNICLSFDDGFANNYKYVLPLLEKYKVPATFFVTAIRNEGYDILWNDFLTIGSPWGPAAINVSGNTFTKNSKGKYISTITRQPLAEMLRNEGFDAKKHFMALMESPVSFKKNKALEDYWLQMTVEEIKRLAASPFATIGSHGYYHNDLAKIPEAGMIKELNASKAFLENIIQKPVISLAFPYGSYGPTVIIAAANAGYQQLLATDFLYAEDKHNPLMKERMGINPFISLPGQMFAIIKGSYG